MNDLGVFFVLAAYVNADLYVRTFDLVVKSLTDIMEQACASCKGCVNAKLACHDSGEVGYLDGVAEYVLAVGSSVLQSAYQADKLVVEAVDVGLHNCALAFLADTLLDFLACLFDGLLNAGGVDAAVLNEPFKGDTRDLAANLVEARLGGVVDDKVNAGERFKGADIASLAADDTALHFVVRNSNDGYCGFRHGVCCKSGDGKGDVLSRDLVLLVLELLLVDGDLYSLFVSQLAV